METYLNKAELSNLRKVCKYTKLSYQAMAARPEVARKLIREHLATAQKSAAAQRSAALMQRKQANLSS